MDSIRVIPIKNKELLSILNEYSKTHLLDGFEKNVRLMGENQKHNRSYLCGEEYLNKIISMKQKHDGFPEHLYGYEYKPTTNETSFLLNSNKIWCVDFLKRISKINQKMMEFLCTRNNALTATYPPGGFISWHNNANAYAFNLIFTWSEKGEGDFTYVEPSTGEIIKIKDIPGWSCKAGYFGSYEEPEKIVYHKAETDCWRTTVSFIYNKEDCSKFAQTDIVEEISNP